MSFKHLISLAATGAVLACSASPAFAQGSIGGGVYAGSGNGRSTTGAAIMIGSTAGIPLVPFTLGVTGFAPLARGGGYALTLDGTFAASKTDAFGGGYGVGQFGNAASGGTLTAFYDHRLAPFTTLEVRGYKTMAAGGGTAGFIGLKVSL